MVNIVNILPKQIVFGAFNYHIIPLTFASTVTFDFVRRTSQHHDEIFLLLPHLLPLLLFLILYLNSFVVVTLIIIAIIADAGAHVCFIVIAHVIRRQRP